MHCDRVIDAMRPDIVAKDKRKGRLLLIDVDIDIDIAVPGDS